MGQDELEPTKSFSERYGMLIEEIIALSLELRVFLLLDDKYNVSSNSVRLKTKHTVSLWTSKQSYNNKE